MRDTFKVLSLLFFAMVVVIVLPVQTEMQGIAGYLPLHTFLETIAVVIAVLVFAVGWNAFSHKLSSNILLLSCVFLGVSILDFSHTLSYSGMPDFVTPGGSEKAINFWLAARSLGALVLLIIAISSWRHRAMKFDRYLLLTGVLVLVGLLHWLFLFQTDLVPHTFISGQGLTPFKITYEYLLIALNLFTALILWLRMREKLSFNAPRLFAAVCIMAMSEFLFTLYADVTDLYNLMGHVYKAIAYLYIYRAIFVSTIQHPYEALHSAQNKLKATINSIPDYLFDLDLNGYCYEYHGQHASTTSDKINRYIGTGLINRLPVEVAERGLSLLQEANEKGSACGEYEQKTDQRNRWFAFTISRKDMESDEKPRFIMLARDITEFKKNEFTLKLHALRNEALLALPLKAEQLDEKAFMQYGQELTEDLTESKVSFTHFVHNDQKTIELVTWSKRTLEIYCHAAYDNHYPVNDAGIWADSLRERRPVIFNDYLNYPHKKGLPEGHSDLHRLISVPVIENNRVVMLTGVGNKLEDYSEQDVETVRLISSEIWRIVQLQRSQNKLILSKNRYQELVDNMSDGITLYEAVNDGEDFVLLEHNHAGENITGLTHEDVIGLRVTEVFPGVVDFGLLEVLCRVYQTGMPEFLLERFYQDERLSFWADNYVYRLPSGEVVAIYTDITNKRLAEKKLQESEQKFRLLSENSPAWIFWKALDSNTFYYVSPACKTITGYDQQAFIDDPGLLERIIHPDDRIIYASHLHQLKEL